MNELQEFAGHARSFQRWILESQSEGASVAREALLELTGLYAAALGLPSPFLADTETEHSARVDDAEFNRVRTWCARLPFQYYGEVFDPTVVPPEEPVAGNVADDIADVYRDVVTGLRLSTQVSSTTPFGSGVLVSELIGASTRPMPFEPFISGLHQTNPTISLYRNQQAQPNKRLQPAALAVSSR